MSLYMWAWVWAAMLGWGIICGWVAATLRIRHMERRMKAEQAARRAATMRLMHYLMRYTEENPGLFWGNGGE